jgi:hypothetical protein
MKARRKIGGTSQVEWSVVNESQGSGEMSQIARCNDDAARD